MSSESLKTRNVFGDLPDRFKKFASVIPVVFNNPIKIIIAAFGFVYLLSLSFAYVEGDDASSIAFHALGRNAAVQPPYSPYHAMMDAALRVLPPHEHLLRPVAITITTLAAVFLLLLICLVVCEWLGPSAKRVKTIAPLVILIVSPEFFYLGLVYTPSVVAMCFVLLSQLLIRHVVFSGKLSYSAPLSVKIKLLASVLLFGFGAACRWNIGAYGLVIVADLIIGDVDNRIATSFNRIALALVWGGLAVTATLAAIMVSGYSLSDIYNVFGLAREISASYSSTFSLPTVASVQGLVTPAFLFLGVFGLIAFFRERKKIVILVGLGIVTVLPFASSFTPKLYLPAIPGLIACVINGFSVLWFSALPRGWVLASRTAVCALMLGPWLVGIQVYSNNTSWGPGFMVRTPERSPALNSRESRQQPSVAGINIGATRISLAVGGGFAVPTMEGPRPLGGHASVLLLGGWRSLIIRLDEERRQAIRRALALGIPVLQDDGNSFMTIHLLQMGFTTEDPSDHLLSGGVGERLFFNNSGQRLPIYRTRYRESLFVGPQLDKLLGVMKSEKVVLYSGYSSTLRKLLKLAPDSVEFLGPFSAILDMRRLRDSINIAG